MRTEISAPVVFSVNGPSMNSPQGNGTNAIIFYTGRVLSTIRTRVGCNRKLHFINKPFIGLVTSGNIFLFYIEERLYIISSEHMSSHPFFRTRHFYCKACESHMLLFCKKRMLKSASFDADPNIYYRTSFCIYSCKYPVNERDVLAVRNGQILNE